MRPSSEGQGEYIGMPLAFLTLRLDNENMALAKVSMGNFSEVCLPGTTYLIRIDNDPIEERECTATAGGVALIFDADTMNRIMEARDVVLETTSPAGRQQMSFDMEGLAFDFEAVTSK